MELSQKLGLGTVQFGLPYGISNKKGQTPAQEVQKVLSSAHLNGIQIIDSASAYGNAEEVLGQNDLSHFSIVSKFLPPLKGSKLSDQFSKSLSDLGLNSLYGYLTHRPLDILSSPEQWEELKGLKAEGKVTKTGFSLNEPEELERLLDKGYNPDLIQVPFNYFDRRFEGLITKLKAEGCEIHTRSAFLQGLFFMDGTKLKPFFDEVKPLLKELSMKKPLNGALLKFVLEKSNVDKVITGVENEQQLIENIKSIENAPSLPELEKTISDNILIPSRWPKN